MGKRRFKYLREDFGDLPVRLNHLTISLNFIDDRVEASNCLDMTAGRDLETITLDARELEILKVESCKGPSDAGGTPLQYEVLRDLHKLVVKLPGRAAAGVRFFVRTLTRCTPSEHILEGIYRDTTPPGAPQQYMSQCQQWGFQRIMPIFDDCRAKCTMTTTLEADARYTHLISNGNVDPRSNPDGRPVLKPGDPSRQVITYVNDVPMAPYLFIACAGTWDELIDEIVYPSGKKVRLEYLVPPGFRENVRIPMEILKQSILWIGRTQDYEYTGDTYRTICMNKSNFGGMENVGNTTIVTDAALITEHTLDASLLYAHAVIVHEFEHNQCGSETTMDTPFDVWLNEAYTVDVERQFMADVFDPAFARANQVESIRNPLLGPLAIEDAGHAGRIVREGFNDPDELIDGVTYVKAAEVIRMLRLILGEERFREGKRLYFSRYRHGNADTDQFFACFEEVSGLSLEQFKKGWLYRIGYPKVRANTHYDQPAARYRIRLTQDIGPDSMSFQLPVSLALVDRNGADIPGTARVFQLRGTESEIVFENIKEAPAFASMNRDYSFYGTFVHENADAETLAEQVRRDPNHYNRIDAMRKLTDIERVRLLKEPDAAVGERWLSLFGEVLSDGNISWSLKAYLLRIDEQPMDRDYVTWYRELVHARERLTAAANERYRSELLRHFMMIDTYTKGQGVHPKEGIEERLLKNTLLEILAAEDAPETHRLIIGHYCSATTATDRVAALLALNRSSAPERRTILEETYERWHGHLSGYANYLRVIASGTRDDVFGMIENEKKRTTFDINQPTWCRALVLPMATNTKMVWSDRGIRWVADTVVELAPLNATTAGRLLNTFQHVKKLKPDLRGHVTAALEQIVANVPDEVCPAVHGQAAAYLS